MNSPDFSPRTKVDAETTADPSLANESFVEPPAEDKEAEYLAAYRLQLKRMSCPGCGEGDPLF